MKTGNADEYRIRIRLMVGLILAALVVLGGRLAYLQLLNAQAYSGESLDIAVREKRVLPARGAIYDRNGVLMVDNEPTYTVTLTPRFFDERRLGLLADLLEVPDSVVARKLEEARAWSAFKPSRSFQGVPFRLFSRLQENAYQLPGVWYEIDQKRRYHTHARSAHVLGFTREITRAELDRRSEDGYRQGDLIGKSGLEKNYEPFLRGQIGSKLVVVNIHGLEVKPYRDGTADIDPESGYDLHLTLDSRLQALAESLFVNKRGAAVAIDPDNGAILAMVSMPDLDPDLFARALSPETWQYLTSSELTPLFNRATMSMMPPGSTWKPFMALMGLQEGVISPTSTIYCGGGHPVGKGRSFRCLGVHGYINVRTAIQKSCNTFFFEVMRRIDVDAFSRYAHQFGFGERAPTDIGEQSPGLIPDSAYYNRTYPRGWTVGYAMNLGIGQGDMGVTPLQMARYAAAIGNGGTLHAPHLVRALRHPETGDVVRPSVPAPETIPIDAAYFDIVRESMRLVMETGSGMSVQIPGIPSGGKTGTAQAPGGARDHSLFVMFAPYDAPRIALGVLVENGGYGATQAGAIASLMAEQYLTGRIDSTPNRLYMRDRLVNELRSETP